MAVLVLMAVAATGPSSASPTADTERAARAERVLIYSLPATTWDDVRAAPLPHLERFLSGSAIGALSVRGVAPRTNAGDGYATLGAGARARGASSAASAFRADSGPPATEAAAELARRTGVVPGDGQLFNIGVLDVATSNRRLDYGARTGLLGSTLADAGVPRAVIAAADRPGRDDWVIDATATLGLADEQGLVSGGEVGTDLLTVDPATAFGVRLDPSAVHEAFRDAWDEGGVVLVEASDLSRWDQYREVADADQVDVLRAGALAASDDLLGRLLAEVDPERDAVLIVGPYHGRGARHLTVAALAAPGVEPGLLRSATTRRSGFVTLWDVAPTVLWLLDLERPGAMEGRPWEVGASGGEPARLQEQLAAADRAAGFRDGHVVAVTLLYGLAQIALWALVVWARRSGDPTRRPALAALAALTALTFLPAGYLATLATVTHEQAAAWWAVVLGVAVVAALVCRRVGNRDPVVGLLAALGTVAGVLAVDVILGAPLQFNAAFGYTPTVAGRFAGYGNLAFAQLAAATLLLAAVGGARVGGRRGELIAAGILGGTVVLVGAPFWGSDVGGVLSLVPAAGLTLWLLAGRTVGIGQTATWGVAAVGLVLAFGVVDLTRPEGSRSHLGRLLEAVAEDGPGPFWEVAARKIDANLGVVTADAWMLVVPVAFAVVSVVVWRAPGVLQGAVDGTPGVRPAVAGVLACMGLGFAVNDSGIAIPAVMLGVLNASVVYLVLVGPGAGPSPPAPSVRSGRTPEARAPVAVDGGR